MHSRTLRKRPSYEFLRTNVRRVTFIETFDIRDRIELVTEIEVHKLKFKDNLKLKAEDRFITRENASMNRE